MAIGARYREEPIAAQWDLPIKGILKGYNDIHIPSDALFDASNVDIEDGTLQGRRGLTAYTSNTVGARPMGAMHFWNTVDINDDYIIAVTTSTVYALQISTGILLNLGGSLTGNADQPVNLAQLAFGTPLTNHAYIVNGKDTPKKWQIGQATVQDLANLGSELVTDGDFSVAGPWTYGTGWARNAGTQQADHTAGNSNSLDQTITIVATLTYRVSFDIANRTAGNLLVQLGSAQSVVFADNGTFVVTLTPTDTTALKFIPSTDFAGSVDNVSVKLSTTPVPVLRDIAIVADRLVGVEGNYTIRWTDPLDDSSWAALNSRVMGETGAPVMGIRTMGTVGGVIYKKDSIWLMEVTGMPGGSAFRVSLFDYVEGPAGSNAIVDAGGRHFYMTETGRIAYFNGFQHKWVADGAWKSVRDEIDSTSPFRVFGVYIPTQEEVRFYYQRSGQSITDGLVILRLENKIMGRPFCAFPGRSGKSVTAGCDVYNKNFTVATGKAIALTSDSLKFYQFSGLSDDGVTVNSFIQTGMVLPNVSPQKSLSQASPNSYGVERVLPIEVFAERNATYGSLTVKAVTSNILDNIGGTLTSGVTLDLTAVPIKSITGVDARGRFVGIRLEWTSAATVKYRSAVLRGQETDS